MCAMNDVVFEGAPHNGLPKLTATNCRMQTELGLLHCLQVLVAIEEKEIYERALITDPSPVQSAIAYDFFFVGAMYHTCKYD